MATFSNYNPAIHHRRSIRLKNYDYSSEGLYFITICCQDRAHLFGEIENGEMKYNIFGKIAAEEWGNSIRIRDNIALHEFIIMPNHIHGIIEILFQKKKNEDIGKFKSPSQTVGSIVRGFKIATIKKIKEKILEESLDGVRGVRGGWGELQFAPTAPNVPTAPTKKILSLDYKIWQRNYYEIIIRDQRAFFNISNYIRNNPKNWKEDKFQKLEE